MCVCLTTLQETQMDNQCFSFASTYLWRDYRHLELVPMSLIMVERGCSLWNGAGKKDSECVPKDRPTNHLIPERVAGNVLGFSSLDQF